MGAVRDVVAAAILKLLRCHGRAQQMGKENQWQRVAGEHLLPDFATAARLSGRLSAATRVCAYIGCHGSDAARPSGEKTKEGLGC